MTQTPDGTETPSRANAQPDTNPQAEDAPSRRRGRPRKASPASTSAKNGQSTFFDATFDGGASAPRQRQNGGRNARDTERAPQFDLFPSTTAPSPETVPAMPTSGSVSGAAPFPASDARDTEIHDAEVPIPTALLTKAPIIETPVTGAPAAAIPDTTMRFMPMPVDLVRFVASVKPGTPDAWLYLCCPDAETAAETLADGLIPDRTTPPVLHEAEAAIAWLAECDDSGGAPNRTGARQSGPSLLRVRRALVESSVESDPDGSYRPGHRVYLLTGGGEGG